MGSDIFCTNHGVLSALFPIGFFLMITWTPGSPYFLLGGREAEPSLMKLRGKTDRQQVNEGKVAVRNVVDEYLHMGDISCTRLFTQRGNRRALILTVTLNLFSSSAVSRQLFLTKHRRY
jgi:hypothetical protein